MKKRKQIIVTAAAGILLALLYAVIFNFSAQDGEQSGNLSLMLSEKCAELLGSLSGKHWSSAVLEGWAEYFQHPLRKLAHFSEYACMGVLVCILWKQWLHSRKKLCLLTVAWVFVSAAGDEFHQLFVPGRYGCLGDVLLDTCGGIFGMLLCLFICRKAGRLD